MAMIWMMVKISPTEQGEVNMMSKGGHDEGYDDEVGKCWVFRGFALEGPLVYIPFPCVYSPEPRVNRVVYDCDQEAPHLSEWNIPSVAVHPPVRLK